MKHEFRNVYREMMKEIEQCMELELPEKDKADNCFFIANNYWSKLKEIIKVRGFKDEADEIDFFRSVKPRFKSYIKYMELLKEVLVCVPSEKEPAITYWQKEIEICANYRKKNLELFIYNECKRSHYDTMYFLRRNNMTNSSVQVPAYDADPEFCTSHDGIISTLLAHTMYSKFARKKFGR